MKAFTPATFAAHLLKVVAAEEKVLHEGLKIAAKIVADEAKKEIGVYQPAKGQFPAWQELAPATKADRVRQGYTENDPLFRSGSLKDSISYQVSGLTAVIGSKSNIAAYQEFGTSRIPPRPFLGPAVYTKQKEIINVITSSAVSGIYGLTTIKKINTSYF